MNTALSSVNHVIDIFDWGNLFKANNVQEQVNLLNKIMLNIFNYIPNKTIFAMRNIHCGLIMKFENTKK